MAQPTRKTIAIDIDDVVAMTSDAIRVWANEKTGLALTEEDYRIGDADYWNYYEAVWQRHGIADQLSFGDFLDSMDEEQGHISPAKDARRVIAKLKKLYHVVFITARRPRHKDSTRRWLDEHIDASIPLYLSANPYANQDAQSKGELCREIGASVLIDDNVDNCQGALDYDVEAIVFGNYGWNAEPPADATRCVSWRDIEEYLDGREERAV